MKDSFGRDITYLRLSVTRRCNLNCVYCGKAGCEKKEEELTAEQFALLAAAFADCGVRKIRLTGGEPLVRGGIVEIVRYLRAIPSLETLALTTNGVYLARYADELRRAGLDSVNVSLDSTDGATYRRLTGADVLHKVFAGIEEAERAGLAPIRINAVLMKGVNADGAADLIDLARRKRVDVRFIELMPFSEEGEDASRRVTGAEILEQFPFLRETGGTDGTAVYYTAEGFAGRVGLIDPVSRKFCDQCSRVRLLCDGSVKPCLGDPAEYDLKPFLNDPARLREEIRQIIQKKPAGHRFGEAKQFHGLNQTGG